ncbi:hypothetical protein AX016_1222 [Cellulophaga sp. RHA19]|uniref:hypothetical protein n=1 Tax=Cellulophaga sp. RHA19 TaxID=1798237 RepID=UPI000C2C7698|nr:hypothetical protein [Cellulophaga sp. RHA19]PKB43040.1 hypothetical protein AX016_1222 [Cellulophaga sp. RHA19]
MKKHFTIILILLLFSCNEKDSDCDEHSKPYYSFTYDIGLKEKHHNTKIKGENIVIRKAFQEIMNTETEISPKNGHITLRLHLDKNGNFCNQESFEIDNEYQPTKFNNGELIKKLKSISNGLLGWTNDTETKTFYLIRFKIKGGKIEEIF